MNSVLKICVVASFVVGIVGIQGVLAHDATQRTTVQQRQVTVLKKVKRLRVVKKTRRGVTLKWKSQAAAKKYQVRVIKKNGKLVKKVRAKKNKKVVAGLRPNTVYRFRVRAKAKKKFGRYSKRLTVRTKKVKAEEVDESASDEEESLLIGFWGLNGYHTAEGLADLSERFNSSVFQVASASPSYTVGTLLPLVRSSGMKITLRMSGSHSVYTTDDDFDLDKWKSAIGTWENSGVQEFIDDGTLVGHMILDDIYTFSGVDPDATDLDEMARYSKEILPDLMTFVRQQASGMPEPESGRYEYVDAVVNQYKASEGDVAVYAASEYAAAQDLGVGVINGLNICDGGDGSSGQEGWRAGKYAMTAEEITAYGTALLDVADLKMFLMWEYDAEETWSDGSTIGSDYFDQADLQQALAGLGEIAARYTSN